MATVNAVNKLRREPGEPMRVRSKCGQCGHFIAETPLDRTINAVTLHYCPSCKSMVRVAVQYLKRSY